MKDWQGLNGHTFTISQLNDFIQEAISFSPELFEYHSQAGIYLNIPSSFDIETSSFKLEGVNGEEHKFACMYIWQFGLNGSVIYGRAWEEFTNLISQLIEYFNLNDHRRLIIYVHNLAYEFGFMAKWFEWDKVFTIKNRRPVYCITEGIEFRCSLFLSNYALAYIGDNLLYKYKVKKLVGSLDYLKIRHSQTPLTDEELAYCVNDVRVVMAYIQEKIEHDGSIAEIPLTNTGYVRNYCRQECFFEDCESIEDRKRVLYNYRALMKSLQITSEDEYNQLHRAFMGGFTHASCIHSNTEPLHDVGSADLTSSYPFAMVAQYYPMSQAEYIGSIESPELLKHYLTYYCCLFDIQFTNIRPLKEYENPLSLSRCISGGKVVTNNGRIVSADFVQTTITELDYDTITKFYTWDSMKILNLRIYQKDYLPRALIVAILKLYEDKTSLKGVFGKEVEYLVSKNMINAAFGMMVTAIIRDDIQYSDHWYKEVVDVVSQLNNYNKNFNRFLFYGWGVWVTAHARHNLFSAIDEFGNDYVYSDTDSIKGINFESHEQYFIDYNNKVFSQLIKMCNHYNIDFQRCQPKTIKGEKKLIGLWEIEKPYKLFKTVGAKRYIYQYEDGFVNMTVSGLNKKFAMPYLIAKWNKIDLQSDEFKMIKAAYNGDPKAISQLIENDYDYSMIFEEFGDGMYIPEGHTGKMTLTYIDDETSVLISDYLGNEAYIHERTSIHMENQSYYMSLIGDYIKFLKGVQYVEY